ncbi:hypothetical protein [uncultured Xylophilus sp.]|uniref:hypothetical protein n=1 Tax=uncultured Xylophilus sp. TaxID=296832 RepID=UPI0025DBF9C7|nr:hypothetical protein [uncultured Xylophilus sp.]
MHTFNLFADYFQFSLQDEAAKGDLSESWTEEAVDRLLAVAPGTVGIRTVRNMDVPVSVEVLAVEPALDLRAWQHVVECSLEVTSPHLVIAGCTDYCPVAARIRVEPGSYRVRACFAELDTLSEDGLEGNDRYHLQLWPAAPLPVVVRKLRDA